MTRWKYDAEPYHPLIKERIPVAPVCPYYGYLVALSKDSKQPTADEIRLLVSCIRYYRETWFTRSDRDRFDSEPFDIYIGINTVIFHKYATSSWAYRRRSWPVERLYPSSPARVDGPVVLTELMDRVHDTDTDRESWRQWKVEHPEVWPEAELVERNVYYGEWRSAYTSKQGKETGT